jgi:hypothetical protein
MMVIVLPELSLQKQCAPVGAGDDGSIGEPLTNLMAGATAAA